MALSGYQIKVIQNALLSGYPTKAHLAMMVRLELDKELDTIAGDSDLILVTFMLIRDAESKGYIRELVNGAYEYNSGNENLKEVAGLLDKWLTPLIVQTAPYSEPSGSEPSAPRTSSLPREEIIAAISKEIEAMIFEMGLPEWLLKIDFLKWILASAAGVGIGSAVAASAGMRGIVAGSMTAVAISFLQWLVLRRHVENSSLWTWTSLMVLGVSVIASSYMGPAWDGIQLLQWIGLSAVIFVIQWLVLRQHHIVHSNLWILASAAGAAIGGVVTIRVLENIIEMELDVVASVFLSGIVGGTIYGAITGGTLFWLLQAAYKDKDTATA